MKKVNSFFVILVILLLSCGDDGRDLKKSGDAEFQKLSEEIITDLLKWSPLEAVALGFHEYDGKFNTFQRDSIETELARLRRFDHAFQIFDTASLSKSTFFDFRLLEAFIKKSVFEFEEIESFTRNPMLYAGALDVSIYVKRNFAPLEERIRSIIEIENKVPELFSSARSNLVDSLPKPFIETAIQIARGSASFLKKDLFLALGEINNDSLLSAFTIANNGAVSELGLFAEYLEKEKLPKANDSYGLGREKYKKMLLYDEGIVLEPAIILEVGTAELVKEQAVFKAMALIINPGKSPVEVYNDIQHEHPTAESLISDIRENVESIRKFLIDSTIINVPPDANVRVEETPKYARSTSTASMDTPGPFEKKATEAFYYITPVDSSWTPLQKEDWLSMFNRYTTDFITIHEVFPGHFTQSVHLNASSATKIEKIIQSYAFNEGWAHYTEKMMIDEGYGNNGDIVRAAKYNLAQSGEALLRLCRLCVSVKMHCEGMSVDDATKFFVEYCHLGEKPARQEAIRGTFDPGYLYYSLGKMMMLKLREDYKKQEGENFSLQKFHDQVLEFGAPPFRLLREKLLKDKNSWSDLLE
jgi:uncharacterized protein (DUF885 family)